MKPWELYVCVTALAIHATFWALPEWWDKNWRELRTAWWERVVAMLIVGYAGYLIGLYAAPGV